MQNLSRRALYLGAFLHDIGKAIQRSGDNLSENDKYYGQHPQQGYQFLQEQKEQWQKLFGSDSAPIFFKAVLAHHESQHFDEEQRADKIQEPKLKCLSTIVSRADNFSSQERSNVYQSQNWHQQKLKPLYNVFENIVLAPERESQNQTRYHYGFEALDLNHLFTQKKHSGASLGQLIDEFRVNFNTFLKTANHDNLDSGLNYLVYKYLWCLPANSIEEFPDVSLYDHLKTTSALAICIYDYHQERNELDNYDLLIDDSLKRFRLVLGDFSGIQKYIFDIAKQEKAGKRLRARSFLVQMMLEDVKKMVLQAFNLPLFNVIFQAGGKFYLLIPNSEQAEEKIANLTYEINQLLWAQYNCEFGVNLSLSDAFAGRSDDEKVLSLSRFEQILTHLNQRHQQMKNQPFKTVLSEKKSFKLKQDFAGQTLCPYCRKFEADQGSMCWRCAQDIKIGEKLKKRRSFFIAFSDQGQYRLLQSRFNLYTHLDDLLASEEKTDLIIVNPDMKQADLKIIQNPFTIAYLGNYIAGDGDLEKIALESCGDKKPQIGLKALGVLKADVDNLGKVFSLGLSRDQDMSYNTISRQETLSRLLELFFAGYLNLIVEKEAPHCYILYAGGDDLVILGPWDELIKLALTIRQEFSRFTNNPALTISASCEIFAKKFPIYQAIILTDTSLNQVKNKGKNGLYLFSQVIKWTDFVKLYPDEFERLDQWLALGKEKKGVSTQFVRSLLTYGEMRSKGQKTRDLMQLPLLTYNIARNLSPQSQPEIYQWSAQLASLTKTPAENQEQVKNIRAHLISLASFALYRNRKG